MTIKGWDISGAILCGGCIYLYSGTLELKNSTISGGKASYGGGIRNDGMAYVLNTIIINNSATGGGDDICNYSNIYAYYSWYNSTAGAISTQADAPNQTTAYDGSLGSLAINIPGTTKTMAIVSGTAAGTGIFAYNTDNTPAGYYSALSLKVLRAEK
jgi:hypothetical protein